MEVSAPQPPQQTIPNPPPESPYHTPSKSLFFVFAFIVIGVAIGIGIFLYNNTKDLRPAPTSTTSGTTSPQDLTDLAKQAKELMEQSKTNNPNGTTKPGTAAPRIIQPNAAQPGQMSTYQNAEGKFSVSYPGELQVRETAQGFGVSSIEFRNAVNSAVPAEYQLLVFPKILGKTIGQDFDKSYAAGNGTVSVIQNPNGGSQKMTKLQNRTVSGQRAFDFQSVNEPADPTTTAEVGTYVEIGNSIAVFSTAQGRRGTLDTMLASFKYPN